MKNFNVKKAFNVFETKLINPAQQLKVKGGDEGGGGALNTPPPPPAIIGTDEIGQL